METIELLENWASYQTKFLFHLSCFINRFNFKHLFVRHLAISTVLKQWIKGITFELANCHVMVGKRTYETKYYFVQFSKIILHFRYTHSNFKSQGRIMIGSAVYVNLETKIIFKCTPAFFFLNSLYSH